MSWNPYDIIIRPIVTEKALTQLNEGKGKKYVFEVRLDAKKPDIKRAVEEIFGVRVAKVNTMIVKPKPKRLGRFLGRTKRWKKAIVTLKPGEVIEKLEVLKG